MIKAFKKFQQQSTELQLIMNAIADFVRPMELNPILDFILLSDVAIGTSATNIQHKLGRPYVGWFVVGRTDSVVPYESATQTNTSSFLTLQAGSATTVDLYIF